MVMLSSTSLLAVTKARLLLVASLALTCVHHIAIPPLPPPRYGKQATHVASSWWLAYLMPRYRPFAHAHVSSRIQDARRRLPSLPSSWPLSGSSASATPPYLYNASKLALIIEPHPYPHLVPLIVHTMAVVPPEWRLLFIGSPWSTYAVGRAPSLRHRREAGQVDIVTLPRPWSVDRPEDVYRLLTDVRFYDEFLPGVEWIFKFEQDSILCANSPRDLDDWLEWSWAGAPRYEQPPPPSAVPLEDARQ